MQNHLKVIQTYIYTTTKELKFSLFHWKKTTKLVFKDSFPKVTFCRYHSLHTTPLVPPNHLSQEMLFQSNTHAAWHQKLYPCKTASYTLRIRVVMAFNNLPSS